MDKKIISISNKMRGGLLDDDYTLFDDGTILHEFDRHSHPGGQNLKENLIATEVSDEIKQRLLNSASDNNKELAHKMLYSED